MVKNKVIREGGFRCRTLSDKIRYWERWINWLNSWLFSVCSISKTWETSLYLYSIFSRFPFLFYHNFRVVFVASQVEDLRLRGLDQAGISPRLVKTLAKNSKNLPILCKLSCPVPDYWPTPPLGFDLFERWDDAGAALCCFFL